PHGEAEGGESVGIDKSAAAVVYHRLREIASYVDAGSSLLTVTGPAPSLPRSRLSIWRRISLLLTRWTFPYLLRVESHLDSERRGHKMSRSAIEVPPTDVGGIAEPSV